MFWRVFRYPTSYRYFFVSPFVNCGLIVAPWENCFWDLFKTLIITFRGVVFLVCVVWGVVFIVRVVWVSFVSFWCIVFEFLSSPSWSLSSSVRAYREFEWVVKGRENNYRHYQTRVESDNFESKHVRERFCEVFLLLLTISCSNHV